MEKILSIVSLGHRAYGRWLFRRLLSDMIIIAGLTIVASIMIGAMLVGALYGLYYTLMSQGMEPPSAALVVAFSILATIASLVILILTRIRYLRRMPEAILKKSPLTARFMDAVEAFSQGLMAED